MKVRQRLPIGLAAAAVGIGFAAQSVFAHATTPTAATASQPAGAAVTDAARGGLELSRLATASAIAASADTAGPQTTSVSVVHSDIQTPPTTCIPCPGPQMPQMVTCLQTTDYDPGCVTTPTKSAVQSTVNNNQGVVSLCFDT